LNKTNSKSPNGTYTQRQKAKEDLKRHTHEDQGNQLNKMHGGKKDVVDLNKSKR
jgi:hypothetical protein